MEIESIVASVVLAFSIAVPQVVLSAPTTTTNAPHHSSAPLTTNTSTTTKAVLVAAAPTPVAPLVSAAVFAKWAKVAQCETHLNWGMHGSRYSGGLGFRNDVWLEHGGSRFAHNAGDATPQQQVAIAVEIQRRGGTDFVPDQDGKCNGW